MSIQALTYVFEHCDARYGARCVMFAIANHADEHGEGCWASVETLGHEAKLKRRQTQTVLRALEDAGEIEVTGISFKGTTIYRIVGMAERVDQLPLVSPKSGSAKSAHLPERGMQDATPGARSAARNVSDIAPEPSRTVKRTGTPLPPLTEWVAAELPDEDPHFARLEAQKIAGARRELTADEVRERLRARGIPKREAAAA